MSKKSTLKLMPVDFNKETLANVSLVAQERD